MDDIDAALERLRDNFIRRVLADRMRALATDVGRAKETPEARDQARRTAHALKGTSGSYGLAELSAALAPLEEELSVAQPDATSWSRVEQLLEGAQEAATRAQRTRE